MREKRLCQMAPLVNHIWSFLNSTISLIRSFRLCCGWLGSSGIMFHAFRTEIHHNRTSEKERIKLKKIFNLKNAAIYHFRATQCLERVGLRLRENSFFLVELLIARKITISHFVKQRSEAHGERELYFHTVDDCTCSSFCLIVLMTQNPRFSQFSIFCIVSCPRYLLVAHGLHS